jgi:hypothetical protein
MTGRLLLIGLPAVRITTTSNQFVCPHDITDHHCLSIAYTNACKGHHLRYWVTKYMNL